MALVALKDPCHRPQTGDLLLYAGDLLPILLRLWTFA
jgi:hypothetical protein